MSKIYIVFSPEGETPPVKQHKTHRAALSAAWIMAKRFPGQSFIVMQSASKPAHVAAEAQPTSVDTHPEGGDANAAPFMSGAAPEGGDAQTPPAPSSGTKHHEQ